MDKLQDQQEREQHEIELQTKVLDRLAGEIVAAESALDPADGRDVLGGKPVGKKIEELQQTYREQYTRLEKRIEKFNRIARGLETGKKYLYNKETELGFAKPYTPIVVRVAKRNATPNKARTRQGDSQCVARW